MPIYAYWCSSCGRETERIRSFEKRDNILVCLCGKDMVRHEILPPAGRWRYLDKNKNQTTETIK